MRQQLNLGVVAVRRSSSVEGLCDSDDDDYYRTLPPWIPCPSEGEIDSGLEPVLV